MSRPAARTGALASHPAVIDDVDWVVPEGSAPPAGIPPEVFAAAARAFARGERLDMQQLACCLGISRATLYRRAGNRDQLCAAVIWSNSRATLVEAVRRTSGLSGVARTVAADGAEVIRAGKHYRLQNPRVEIPAGRRDLSLVGRMLARAFGKALVAELVPVR